MDVDMDAVMNEFIQNGITKDLDEYDLLLLECRRKKSFVDIYTQSCTELNQSIEKVRSTLSGLRPLGKKMYCVFCRKNNEKPEVYSTHLIRNENGNVTCPILQKYSCPICGATGIQAHTMKYCPLNDGIVTTTDAVLRTPRNSSGKLRIY